MGHASAASLAECSDLPAWFGIDQTKQVVWYWIQAYGEYHEEKFTADPNRVAVDEKQVQLAEGEKMWLYAAIDADSKVVLHYDFRSPKELIQLPSFSVN